VNERGQTVIRTTTRFRAPDGRVQEQVSEQVVGGPNAFGGAGPGGSGQQMTPEEMARQQQFQKQARGAFKSAVKELAKEHAKKYARKKMNDVMGWFKKKLS